MVKRLRTELQAYLQRCKIKVEDQCSKIRVLREKFEDSWRALSQNLEKQHDADVITGYHSMKSDIGRVLEGKCYEPALRLSKIFLSFNNTGYEGWLYKQDLEHTSSLTNAELTKSNES